MMCEPDTPGSIERILQIDEPEVGAGITSVAISSDSRLIAAGSLDTIILIWDAHTGELLEKLYGHQDCVYSVAFTIDGKGLISSSLDNTAKCWDLRSITDRGRNEADRTPISSTMTFIAHKDFVLSVAASSNGN
jgi:glucose repression regulatory protein TUP1